MSRACGTRANSRCTADSGAFRSWSPCHHVSDARTCERSRSAQPENMSIDSSTHPSTPSRKRFPYAADERLLPYRIAHAPRPPAGPSPSFRGMKPWGRPAAPRGRAPWRLVIPSRSPCRASRYPSAQGRSSGRLPHRYSVPRLRRSSPPRRGLDGARPAQGDAARRHSPAYTGNRSIRSSSRMAATSSAGSRKPRPPEAALRAPKPGRSVVTTRSRRFDPCGSVDPHRVAGPGSSRDPQEWPPIEHATLRPRHDPSVWARQPRLSEGREARYRS